MKTSDFDFELPKELIAQSPLEKRDHSRLLVLNRENDSIEHQSFYKIIDYLNENDLLVINDTKVLPARLIGEKVETKAVIEILLLKEVRKDVWETLVKPAKRVKVGTKITFSNLLSATCLVIKSDGIMEFEFFYDGIFIECLEKLGSMPLPPYITERLKDNNRYQTVYAANLGSAAAPTAGLHFTSDLITKIKEKGIQITSVTLHVGLGTFRPVKVDNISDHDMHKETYTITASSADMINEAIKNKKRIIAVGTTTVRTLESNFKDMIIPGTFETNIFIYPGYEFKVVNGIITNFHLPKSTLIMLISAFANIAQVKNAYLEAIKNEYRFFSFGDAMLIL